MTEHESDREIAELIRAVDVPAPQALHDRVHQLVDARTSRRRRETPRRWRTGAAVAAAAVAIIALVLVLTGPSHHELTLRQASALATRSATSRAPSESPGHGAQLAVANEGLHFPYWAEHFGWHATGSRVDRVAGRTVVTVSYEDRHGRQVGYAIVGGVPAPDLPAGSARRRHGTTYRVTTIGGATVVSWLRQGRLCVVAGRGVGAGTLLALASWHERATPA